jgi:nicotinate phosphoribosyltransferase
VYAGTLFGIPTSGTMAHSFVMSYDDELTAFRDYYAQYPDATVLLLDTYDTLEAARNVSAIGKNVKAVRLDSGNILTLSQKVRKILDDAGMSATKIFVSGDLDEYRIAELIEKGACVDGFGVGTRLVTCDDAPSLSTIYKLVEVQRGKGRRHVAKFSEGKETYPGRKQVVRFVENGGFTHDLVMLADEPAPEGGVPLLEKMLENGKAVKKLPRLEAVRTRAAEQMRLTPKGVKARHKPDRYDVRISKRLEALRRLSADAKIK